MEAGLGVARPRLGGDAAPGGARRRRRAPAVRPAGGAGRARPPAHGCRCRANAELRATGSPTPRPFDRSARCSAISAPNRRRTDPAPASGVVAVARAVPGAAPARDPDRARIQAARRGARRARPGAGAASAASTPTGMTLGELAGAGGVRRAASGSLADLGLLRLLERSHRDVKALRAAVAEPRREAARGGQGAARPRSTGAEKLDAASSTTPSRSPARVEGASAVPEALVVAAAQGAARALRLRGARRQAALAARSSKTCARNTTAAAAVAAAEARGARRAGAPPTSTSWLADTSTALHAR